MAVFNYEGVDVYYRLIGQGETLCLLNGIMMSTSSWLPFEKALSKDHQLLLVDFIDQGKSGHIEREYDQMLMVDMLKALFDELGIKRLHLLGISYGGEVGMKFGMKYGHMLHSLMLFNTTPYTTEKLKGIGEAWKHAGKDYDGKLFFNVTLPSIYSDVFYEANANWISDRIDWFAKNLPKSWYDGFLRLVDSADHHHCVDDLHELTMPMMVVSGEKDDLTPLHLQALIVDHCPHAQWHIVQGAGHALMYEAPKEFLSLVKGFLLSYDEVIKL